LEGLCGKGWMERGFIVRVWIAVWVGKHTDRENI
jgi:hypothetical protein